MKNYFSKLSITLSLLLSLNAKAMVRETGGSSRAPQAVVIQGHLVDGSFDYEGWQKARHLAYSHVSQEWAVFVTEAAKLQYPDRAYLCVEYNNNDDFNAATEQFKSLLAKHISIEVVANSNCPR